MCDSFEDIRNLPYPDYISFRKYETKKFREFYYANKNKIYDLQKKKAIKQ